MIQKIHRQQLISFYCNMFESQSWSNGLLFLAWKLFWSVISQAYSWLPIFYICSPWIFVLLRKLSVYHERNAFRIVKFLIYFSWFVKHWKSWFMTSLAAGVFLNPFEEDSAIKNAFPYSRTSTLKIEKSEDFIATIMFRTFRQFLTIACQAILIIHLHRVLFHQLILQGFY